MTSSLPRFGRASACLPLLGLLASLGCSDALTDDTPVQGPTAQNDATFGLDGGQADGAGADQAAPDDTANDGAGLDTIGDPDGAGLDTAGGPDDTGDASADAPGNDVGGGCDGGCAPGYICFDEGIDSLPVCVPGPAFACAPCASDATCLGGVCHAFADGKACLIPCAIGPGGSSCPAGASCVPVDGALRCVPDNGSCTCGPGNDGASEPCPVGTGLGICAGVRTCSQASGWSACSALPATAEACNALDDDCDGQTDEGLGGEPCGPAGAPACQGVTVCLGAEGVACDAPGATTETCNGQDDDCDGQIDDEVGAGVGCEASNEHGTCAGTVQCQGAQGLVCDAKQPAAEACNGIDDDCDGEADEGFVDAATGLYLQVAHCGGCNLACPTAKGPHTVASCALGAKGLPGCGLACADSWVDMDGSLGNGCECQKLSDVDEPDGVDQNCDGIDGDISQAVFVAKTGADGNPGTLALPVASIAKAVEIAAQAGKRDVYVAGGVYTGFVDLQPGVSVYGGYGPGYAVRDTVNHQSAIVGTVPPSGPNAAVRCFGITGGAAVPKTRVDGFVILSAAAKVAGGSSYGVFSGGCDDRLQLTYNAVVAGDGAAGVSGEPGVNGEPGVDGQDGAKAKDIGHDGCLPADHNAGGQGGVLGCGGGAVSGGAGGTAICAQFDEDTPTPACPAHPYKQTAKTTETGLPGQGAGAGSGGDPGADSYIDSNKGVATKCKGKITCNTCVVPVAARDGQDGAQGQKGNEGEAGSGCSADGGAIVAGAWASVSGGSGGVGGHGGGGGGGGAAGGVEVHDCAGAASGYPDIGGSGGGGGSGGCGGTGGLGGTSGGASFALFLLVPDGAPAPIVVGNTLASGNGGAGAVGGAAGSGGPGGQGGKGGASSEEAQKTFCTSKGGTGGAGGNAGHGGGGGGGCGGPSALLVLVNAAPGSAQGLQKLNQLKAVGVGGKGGGGGPSIGQVGLPGKDGKSQAVLVF